jgi:hypothetical protein
MEEYEMDGTEMYSVGWTEGYEMGWTEMYTVGGTEGYEMERDGDA